MSLPRLARTLIPLAPTVAAKAAPIPIGASIRKKNVKHTMSAYIKVMLTVHDQTDKFKHDLKLKNKNMFSLHVFFCFLFYLRKGFINFEHDFFALFVCFHHGARKHDSTKDDSKNLVFNSSLEEAFRNNKKHFT